MSRKSPRLWGAVALLGLCLGCSSGEEGKAPAATQTKAAEPAQIFEGLTIEGGDPQSGLWLVTAETGTAEADGSYGKLSGVNATFTGQKGEVTARADTCELVGDSGLKLGGDVVIGWNGWTARTQSARYLQKQSRVASDSEVLIDGDALTISGTGLEIDIAGQSARLKSRVHAVIRGVVK